MVDIVSPSHDPEKQPKREIGEYLGEFLSEIRFDNPNAYTSKVVGRNGARDIMRTLQSPYWYDIRGVALTLLHRIQGNIVDWNDHQSIKNTIIQVLRQQQENRYCSIDGDHIRQEYLDRAKKRDEEINLAIKNFVESPAYKDVYGED